MEKGIKLKKVINRLSGADAKSMLFFSLMNEQAKDSIIEFLLQQGEGQHASNIQTVHIVFGHSPGGSLKAILRQKTYEKTEQIIVIPGNFSVGPLKDLHTWAGIETRFRWFQERYLMDSDEIAITEHEMKEAVEKIKKIPEQQNIIIWTCQNAHEQIGLRLVLALLANKTNDIYVLDTFELFHELRTRPKLAEENYPRSTGEVVAKDLLYFYEQYHRRPLKTALRQALCKEGLNMLMDDYHCLRTWEYHKLGHHNNENIDDDFIITCVERLHKEQGDDHYQNAAKVIGEVVGYFIQYREPEWIEYRLRQLIQQGLFSYQGELKGMLHYQVKLSD
ncbi:DUF1835 domain-containing protein [Lysinibacillus fusiformis]|uniref:DUF1835 domain-containing protein n=1 Tax=Lysinibacillus fusiformis TaxID=28031 RepID=UPI000468C5DA|nr:DUF1835 domain-containing protein [Lysinibacillus fusiformis]